MKHLSIAAVVLGAATLVSGGAGHAGPVGDKVARTGIVRVCIWPDYYGITYRNPRNQSLTGIDAELSVQLAQDLGVRLEHVDSSFATLVPDLENGKCDVAMFAIGTLPQRLESLRFTRPYLQSDIYGVTTRGSRVVRGWEDIDKPGVQVGVQAGTFMEPVMAQTLKHAQMVVVRPPTTRERELESGRIDVFMSDYPYSRRLLDNADWAELVSPSRPFHVLPYAYAVRPGDDAWLQTIEKFVERIKADGRLDAAARRNGLSAIVVR